MKKVQKIKYTHTLTEQSIETFERAKKKNSESLYLEVTTTPSILKLVLPSNELFGGHGKEENVL